jgi:tRNA pseudouridine13 synthase
MKLKRLPEDFQVDELTEFAAAGTGEFAFYRLAKRGLGTPEAIAAVVERWKLSRNQVSLGGLKDRHAVTTQYLTIHHGPRRSLRQTHLELEYLGQSQRPFGPADFRGNRFRIVVRSMVPAEIAAAETSLAEIERDGLPNYFDDQRFGSLGESGEFVARAWIAGDWERAVWLAVADANPLDRPRDRAEKSWLREHWGDWPACVAKLGRTPRADVVGHLQNRPGDFRGALTRIRPEQRNLYLAAFQSFLWNRLLSDFIVETCQPDQIIAVEVKMGELPFFTSLDDATRRILHSTELPLPSSRIRLEEGPIRQVVERSLGELGLTMREIRVKYPRDSFFSKGWRPAIFAVTGLSHEVADDELYPGRRKLTLSFDLSRGTYATILIKRVAACALDATEHVSAEADTDSHEEETEATV